MYYEDVFNLKGTIHLWHSTVIEKGNKTITIKNLKKDPENRHDQFILSQAEEKTFKDKLQIGECSDIDEWYTTLSSMIETRKLKID